MIFVGLSFKITAAPFHMWAPDVYQGAPTPVTAFLSVVSKTAGFVLLIRIFLSIFAYAASSGPNYYLHFGDDAGLYCFYCGSNDDHREYYCIKATQYETTLCLLKHRSRGISFSGVIASFSGFMFDSMWFYLISLLIHEFGCFCDYSNPNRKIWI